VPVEHK